LGNQPTKNDSLLANQPDYSPAGPEGEVSGRAWWRRALRYLPALIIVGLCALLLPRLELGRVLAALRDADWRLVALAAVVNMTLNVPSRTMRWWALLRPLPRRRVAGDTGPGFRELTSLLLASYATSNLLPARAGEALRTVQPNRRHGYPIGAMVASQLVEKLVEALSMAALAFPIVLWAHPSPALAVPLELFAAVTAGGVVAVLVVSRRAPHPDDDRSARYARVAAAEAEPGAPPSAGGRLERLVRRWWAELGRFLRRLAQAVRRMSAPRVWAASLLWSAASDLADVAAIGLCAHAVGIHVGVAGWFVVFLAVNIAIAVPSTPGQVGVFEAGAVLALGTLGVGQNEALAFAILYHAANAIPITLVGVLALREEWREPAAAKRL
jgi:uncharacterized membrane protein YbhN (UPF0104 family)